MMFRLRFGMLTVRSYLRKKIVGHLKSAYVPHLI